MISSYIYIGISFSIFWGIFLLRKKNTIPYFGKGTLFLFYALTRLVPVAMLFPTQNFVWRNLLLELPLIFFFVFYIRRTKSQALFGCLFAFYLFFPGIPLGILTGNLFFLPIALLFFSLLCVLDTFLNSRGGTLMAFSSEYIIASIGILGLFTAVSIFGQHFKGILADSSKAEEFPVLYVISLLFILYAGLRCVWRIYRRNFHIAPLSLDAPPCRSSSFDDSACLFPFPGKALTVTDLVLMLVLTLAFGAAAFYHLGSTRAPETFRTLNFQESGNNEIVLSFGSDTYISDLYIYLGYTGKAVMSFSSTDQQNSQWDVFESRHELSDTFAWNRVEVNRSVNLLGLVLMEGSTASLHEIVCLDAAGNPILPANASYYRELFDEQGLFVQPSTYYNQTMFDEVYHARTAYEFIHGLSIYENTHPPLGKIIIGLGIRAFGMNPFGWRLMCVILGTLMIPVIYLFGHALTGSPAAAFFSATLLATEFMHFTLSRIATIDIIVAFFVMLMFFFLYLFLRCCNPRTSFGRQFLLLFLCGISTGLAISTKWTGLYATLGIAILFFVFLFSKIRRFKEYKSWLIRLFFTCCLCFILIPGVIYLLSYLPFTRVYTDKGLLQTAIANAQLMLSYHSTTVFDHPYSSEWYSWLLDLRPLLDTITSLGNGTSRSIATFGNPLIWWGGLVALFHQFYLWHYKKCRNALYLIIAYCSVLFPWFFIHRTVFIYQYFLASNLLILMITNSLQYTRHKKRWMTLVGVSSLGLFILFFPVLSGTVVTDTYVQQVLKWLPTWIL